MIIEHSHELKKYLKEIDSLLPHPRAKKREIIETIENSIIEFLEHNPDADISKIKKHFGSAETIAEEYGSVIDQIEFHKIVQRKKKLWYMIAAAIMILFLAALVAIWICFKEESKSFTEYYVVEEAITDLSSEDNIWNNAETVIE